MLEAINDWRDSFSQDKGLDQDLIDSKMMELMIALIQQRYIVPYFNIGDQILILLIML
jgi:hypothetical protein